MASVKKRKKLPRLPRGSKDALVAMCVYTAVCATASSKRTLEHLVSLGYAKRCRLSVRHPEAQRVVKGKTTYIYKVTPAGLKALRLVYNR